MRRIGRALRRFEPDVIHAHEPLVPSTAMWAAIAAPRTVPVVATFHAFAERSTLLTVASPILRPVWNRLDVRLAVSEAAAGFVARRFRGPVRVVPNGLDVEAFAHADPATGLPEGRRVLWVARLDPQKGFGVALSAFERLLEDRPDAVLVVAGAGRDRDLVGRSPTAVRRRVHLLGAVPHGELPALLAAADVFVSPALGQESFGLTLVEAMAAGVPVVASDIAGYREVVRDGVDGWLVPPGDPGALAAALEKVLGDPEEAARLHRAGPARAERYAWRSVVRQVEAAYEEARSLRPAGRRG